MKCICGYENNDNALKGTFKQIQIRMEGLYCEVRDNKRDEHYIYACPKCGTLKIEV